MNDLLLEDYLPAFPRYFFLAAFFLPLCFLVPFFAAFFLPPFFVAIYLLPPVLFYLSVPTYPALFATAAIRRTADWKNPYQKPVPRLVGYKERPQIHVCFVRESPLRLVAGHPL